MTNQRGRVEGPTPKPAPTSATPHPHPRSPACAGFCAVSHAPPWPAAVHSIFPGWETSERNGSGNLSSIAESARLLDPARGHLRGASSRTIGREPPTSAAPHPTCRCAPAHLQLHCMADSASNCGIAVPCHKIRRSRAALHIALRSDRENKFAKLPCHASARAPRARPLVLATGRCARRRENREIPKPCPRPPLTPSERHETLDPSRADA